MRADAASKAVYRKRSARTSQHVVATSPGPAHVQRVVVQGQSGQAREPEDPGQPGRRRVGDAVVVVACDEVQVPETARGREHAVACERLEVVRALHGQLDEVRARVEEEREGGVAEREAVVHARVADAVHERELDARRAQARGLDEDGEPGADAQLAHEEEKLLSAADADLRVYHAAHGEQETLGDCGEAHEALFHMMIFSSVQLVAEDPSAAYTRQRVQPSYSCALRAEWIVGAVREVHNDPFNDLRRDDRERRHRLKLMNGCNS